MTSAGWRRPLVAAGGVIVGFLVGMLVTLLLLDATDRRFAFLYDDFSIGSCLTELDAAGIPAADAAARRELTALCYDRLVRQGQINEFQIRRVSFENQHVADRVVLWMVVCLTLSGVALAAVQIVGSLRMFGGDGERDSEFTVEKGRVALRSSVTGLFILLISFAFFYTYIIFVYQIVEVGQGLEADVPAARPGVPLLRGRGGRPRPAAGV